MSTYSGVNVYLCLAQCLNCLLNVKALGASNQEKALVEAFSVITNLHVELRLKTSI